MTGGRQGRGLRHGLVVPHRRLTRRFGDAVEPWLEDLPRRLVALGNRWNLQVGEVIPQGSMSVVIRCRAREGQPAVLKLTPDTKRLADEAAALRQWSGAHAPNVLEAHTGVTTRS